MNKMKKSVHIREELEIPTYTLGKKPKRIKLKVIIPVAVVLLLALAIYLPPLFFDCPETTYDSTAIAPDASAMETAITYLRNNITADFDGDGLSNEEENKYGSGVYIIDNDNDGTTDYAELYVTESNPCVYDDSIVQWLMAEDSKSGNNISTPFKVHDIVMWADDYESKARGSVIETYENCYRFSNFTGWVQFPTNVYAYEVKDGYQAPLQKSEQGYYHISAVPGKDVLVRTYDSLPESCYVISFLNNSYMLNNNFLGEVLHFILPNEGYGLITCKSALFTDFDDTWKEKGFINSIIKYDVGELSPDRFARDCNQLSDLSNILRQLDEGNNVILSLMSHTEGEVIVEVYGYTNRNNFLVCDPKTGNELGYIKINVVSRRLLDQSGAINQYEYFTFDGCGYSSSLRHRMAIIDYISPAGESVSQNEGSETDGNETPTDIESVPPTVTPKPEASIVDQVFGVFNGKEEASYFESDGRFQKTFNGVNADEFATYSTTLREKFNKYFDDSESTEEAPYMVLADEAGNIVSLKYIKETQELTVHIETADSAKTIELKEDKFISDIGEGEGENGTEA